MRPPPPPLPHHRTLNELERMSLRDPYWSRVPLRHEQPPLAAEKETTATASGGEEKEKQEDLPPAERGMSEVLNDKEKYQVTLDVAHFIPDEISVRGCSHIT